ncbi:MAG: translation initiation factor IF-3 [Solirubrobacteraceae bacterium]
MAVPRRFDRRPPERDLTRINDRIRVPEVRVIDDEGNQVGMMKTPDAVKFAQERDLDLVEVAPEAKPPVCRVLDYSKYKYEQAQKVKQARKHQQQITIREIKFRPKIAQHDYDTKKHHVERFLRHKDKVKITIMFRGREVTHPERGVMILDRLAEELAELGVVEQRPTQDGRNMTMMLGPSKSVLAGKADEADDASDTVQADGAQADTAQADTAQADTVQADGAQPEGSPDGVAAAAQPASSDGVVNAVQADVSVDGAANGTRPGSSLDGGAGASGGDASPEDSADSPDADVSPEGAEQSAEGEDGVPGSVVS